MNNKKFLNKLNEMHACDEAKEWVEENGGDFATLWNQCRRGDWMSWFVANTPRLNKSREFILANCDVAEFVLKKCKDGTENYNLYRDVLKSVRALGQGSGNIQAVWDAKNAVRAAEYDDDLTSVFTELADIPRIPEHSYDVPNYGADAILTYAGTFRGKSYKKFADIFRKYFHVGQRGLTTVKGVNND